MSTSWCWKLQSDYFRNHQAVSWLCNNGAVEVNSTKKAMQTWLGKPLIMHIVFGSHMNVFCVFVFCLFVCLCMWCVFNQVNNPVISDRQCHLGIYCHVLGNRCLGPNLGRCDVCIRPWIQTCLSITQYHNHNAEHLNSLFTTQSGRNSLLIASARRACRGRWAQGLLLEWINL